MTALRLQVQALTVRRDRVAILDGVDLAVAAGERHAIVGLNGAGKTTLLTAIGGGIRPDSGRILLDGADITGRAPHRIARLGVGRTWQHPAILAHLTAADNVALSLRHGPDGGQTPAEILESAGLGAQAGIPAGALSYGQQRRLELAAALAQRPNLLLLDEPSSGLADADVAALVTQLRSLARSVSVVLVDHRGDVISGIADTVTELRSGQVFATGPFGPMLPSPTRPAPPAAGATGEAPLALTAQHLTVVRRGVPVLTDVAIDIEVGHITAVRGPNGSGKSTLLSALAGLLPVAPGGRIVVDGNDVAGLSPARRARLGVALLPQGRRLWPDLTVAEHLQVGRHDGIAADVIWEHLPELADRRRRHARTLSGGEQQLLGLARAASAGSRVLLLDEPFEGLSPAALLRAWQLLVALAEQGTGVLLADHHSDVVARAHRVIEFSARRKATANLSTEPAYVHT
jgi:branched-chain amino acid transport system ATP-binding protein